MSYPLREFDLQKRVQCFLFKAAELCMVGLSAGAVQGALSNTLAKKKEGRCVGSKPSLCSIAFKSLNLIDLEFYLCWSNYDCYILILFWTCHTWIVCRLSVTVPTVSSNALGYGAFLGIYANLRYQLLCGFDRGMVRQFDVIGVALFFSTAFRYAFSSY